MTNLPSMSLSSLREKRFVLIFGHSHFHAGNVVRIDGLSELQQVGRRRRYHGVVANATAVNKCLDRHAGKWPEEKKMAKTWERVNFSCVYEENMTANVETSRLWRWKEHFLFDRTPTQQSWRWENTEKDSPTATCSTCWWKWSPPPHPGGSTMLIWPEGTSWTFINTRFNELLPSWLIHEDRSEKYSYNGGQERMPKRSEVVFIPFEHSFYVGQRVLVHRFPRFTEVSKHGLLALA